MMTEDYLMDAGLLRPFSFCAPQSPSGLPQSAPTLYSVLSHQFVTLQPPSMVVQVLHQSNTP